MAALQHEHAPGWLRRAALAVLVLGFFACAGEAGSGPADPTLLPPGVTQPPVGTDAEPAPSIERVPVPGFGDTIVEVTRLDGRIVSWCLLLADTPELRRQGLMHVTDPALGGYDGMLFRYDEPSIGSFWMRNTPQALSIAYVDEAGEPITITEMVPCGDDPQCPGYPPSGPYRLVVEVPTAVGGVGRLGIEPGATVRDVRQPCSVPDG